MNNPFLVWYFKVYELSAAFWLRALSAAGRYPPARDERQDVKSGR